MLSSNNFLKFFFFNSLIEKSFNEYKLNNLFLEPKITYPFLVSILFDILKNFFMSFKDKYSINPFADVAAVAEAIAVLVNTVPPSPPVTEAEACAA